MIEIRITIAEDSIRHADRMYGMLYEAFGAIARMPGIGPTSVEMPEARRFPIGNYNIYYKQGRGQVVISRVIHAKRDQKRAWSENGALTRQQLTLKPVIIA